VRRPRRVLPGELLCRGFLSMRQLPLTRYRQAQGRSERPGVRARISVELWPCLGSRALERKSSRLPHLFLALVEVDGAQSHYQ
jgi:hypothetical protein